MLKKVHQKLTFLFTGIAGLILIVMSICYLYMSEKELKDNHYLSFISESNTILSNFEQQKTLSHSWLSRISVNSSYLLAIYDNGIPLTFTSIHLSEKEQLLASSVLSCALEKLSAMPSASQEYQPVHVEFSYETTEHILYYVSAAEFGKSSSPLHVLILSSTQPLTKQLAKQRIRFIIIDITGILLLFLFSYYYTKRLLAPIQENHEKQNAFIAAASHELRTPLAVILSSIQASRQADDTMREQFLLTIEKEGRRMSTLINDMLLLTRADNHTWSFTMQKTELDTLLLNSYEAFLPLAKENQLSLEILLPEKRLPPCLCDAQRITQVLAILISNALSYNIQNGFIKLRLSYTSPYFYLTVQDSGIGISPEAKAHIFDRFYRADASRSQKDHFGLGLCIAREIIDAHHGSIHVTDTPGGGTTFTVKLREI